MGKDYRRRPTRQSNAPRQFFVVLASFLFGYLTATVFDITSLTTWLNANVLNQKNPPPTPVVAKAPETPKPKFEFYTLLSKDNQRPASRTPANPPVTVAQPRPQSTSEAAVQVATQQIANTKPAVASTESYSIQVASFSRRQDAEHVKANLVLKGFDVNIVSVNQNNNTWYRVIVGPFTSKPEAEKAQLAMAKSEHMHGMIRRGT